MKSTKLAIIILCLQMCVLYAAEREYYYCKEQKTEILGVKNGVRGWYLVSTGRYSLYSSFSKDYLTNHPSKEECEHRRDDFIAYSREQERLRLVEQSRIAQERVSELRIREQLTESGLCVSKPPRNYGPRSLSIFKLDEFDITVGFSSIGEIDKKKHTLKSRTALETNLTDRANSKTYIRQVYQSDISVKGIKKPFYLVSNNSNNTINRLFFYTYGLIANSNGKINIPQTLQEHGFSEGNLNMFRITSVLRELDFDIVNEDVRERTIPELGSGPDNYHVIYGESFHNKQKFKISFIWKYHLNNNGRLVHNGLTAILLEEVSDTCK